MHEIFIALVFLAMIAFPAIVAAIPRKEDSEDEA